MNKQNVSGLASRFYRTAALMRRALAVSACGLLLWLLTSATATAAEIVGNTSILSQAHADGIEQRIGQCGVYMTLRYRSDVDGEDSTTFHSLIDGITRTLTVYRVTSPVNALVSGYVDTPWTSNTGYTIVPVASSNAFITRLDTMTHAGPVYQYQKFNRFNYGPTFGGGHDIFVNETMDAGYMYSHTYPFAGNTNLLGFLGYVPGGPSGTATQVTFDRIETFEVTDNPTGTFELNYAAGPFGSVSGNTAQVVPCSGSGTPVTAIPGPNATFVQWSDGVTDNPRTDTNVVSSVNVTAEFEIQTFTLSYAAGPDGTISGTTPQTVAYGFDGSPVTAVPDANHHFVQWSDGVLTATRTDTNVMANLSVSAQFAIDTYTLSYTAGANGSISGSSMQTVDHGSDGSAVTAVPDANHHFVQWSDGVLSATRTDTNVMANLSVTAQFAIDTYTLSYAAGANGSISGISPQTVDHGSDGSAVTAIPDANHHFVQW
ncbi:MAG: TLD domain-containing protein, partial [Xanthomonadales bacterium]|nr:TLD domain-containing protein [Xanthomonadales bacterium]